MKKALLPFVLFFCLVFFAKAQDIPTKDVVFRQCNTVVVYTDEDAPTAFRKVQLIMRNNGLTTSNLNPEMFSATGSVVTKNTGTVIINFYVTDQQPNRIIFSGSYDPNMRVTVGMFTAGGPNRIEYIGIKGSAPKAAFGIMEDIAKGYEGGRVFYGYRK